MIGSVAKLMRWQDWGHSKMPPFFAAGFLFLLASGGSAAQGLIRFIAWIVFCAVFLAFGYGINDFADREADRRAGKPNAMDKSRSAAAVAWLFSLLSVGLAVIVPFLSGMWDWLAVASSYCLAIAYSLPPLRLKERGLAGLLACALAQRSLPLLVGAVLFGQLDLNVWLLFVLFTLIGLRWILLHQVVDLAQDERSRVRTFVRASGSDRALFLLSRGVFPLELAVLAAWLVSAARDLPMLWLVMLVYLGYLRALGYLWRRTWPPFHWSQYWLHPLADFYEIVWPLFLGIVLVVSNPAFSPLLFLLILWQSPRAVRQFAFYRCLRRRLRGLFPFEAHQP